MPPQDVVIVHLRRPGSEDPRDDPFWEFGSFGLTGCHAKNLLSPRNALGLTGKRLAFAQGGRKGTRLLLLTPPVSVLSHGPIFEVKWDKSQAGMPFRYDESPVLVQYASESEYRSDFPRTAHRSANGIRPPEGQFASSFRSRVLPVEPVCAREIIRVYERLRKKAPEGHFAREYYEALPWPISCPRQNRRAYYDELLMEAQDIPKCRKAKSPADKPRQNACGESADVSFGKPGLPRGDF